MLYYFKGSKLKDDLPPLEGTKTCSESWPRSTKGMRNRAERQPDARTHVVKTFIDGAEVYSR